MDSSDPGTPDQDPPGALPADDDYDDGWPPSWRKRMEGEWAWAIGAAALALVVVAILVAIASSHDPAPEDPPAIRTVDASVAIPAAMTVPRGWQVNAFTETDGSSVQIAGDRIHPGAGKYLGVQCFRGDDALDEIAGGLGRKTWQASVPEDTSDPVIRRFTVDGKPAMEWLVTSPSWPELLLPGGEPAEVVTTFIEVAPGTSATIILAGPRSELDTLRGVAASMRFDEPLLNASIEANEHCAELKRPA